MENDYLKIINHFGVNNQQRKLQEEVFELQEAIYGLHCLPDFIHCDDDELYKSYERTFKKNLLEEIVDVQILIQQFIEYYELDSKDLKKMHDKKVKRTLKRMKEGYYEANTR